MTTGKRKCTQIYFHTVSVLPVDKAMLQLSMAGGVIELTKQRAQLRLERSARSPLSSPGLLLRFASWERLESSAGANKAGHYARPQERVDERERERLMMM